MIEDKVIWEKPRTVSVVVDNPSWILPYAKRLSDELCGQGDNSYFCESHSEVKEGTVAFYLGCMKITPLEVLRRNKYNVVVHQSDLPKGRGFSPLTYQILEGKNDIIVSALEAVEKVDAGPIYYKDILHFEGHELIDELLSASAEMSLKMCKRFLREPNPPIPKEQVGDPTFYPRIRPKDSIIDPNKSIAEQWNRLRVADPMRHPTYFDHLGHRYKLVLEKIVKNDTV